MDFSEEEEAEMDEPGLEDVVAFAEESGVEKATTAIEKNSSESNGGVAAKDDDSTDDDDDAGELAPSGNERVECHEQRRDGDATKACQDVHED